MEGWNGMEWDGMGLLMVDRDIVMDIVMVMVMDMDMDMDWVSGSRIGGALL